MASSETNAQENTSEDEDNDTSAAEEVAETEGGAVLGAERTLGDNTETAVEEGGSVLGADRGRSPKTGDAANVLGAVATMGSSLAGAVLGLRRRNK